MPLAEPVHEHTDYEFDINKPMPSLNYTVLEGNLLFQNHFNAGIRSLWLVMPSLKAIAVYTKADHYQFYSSEMILHDEVLDIELPLQTILGI